MELELVVTKVERTSPTKFSVYGRDENGDFFLIKELKGPEPELESLISLPEGWEQELAGKVFRVQFY